MSLKNVTAPIRMSQSAERVGSKLEPLGLVGSPDLARTLRSPLTAAARQV